MDDVNLADLMTDAAPAVAEVVSTEPTTEQPSQARDEKGRFAPDQVTDHDARAAVEGAAAATTEQPAGTVPQQALHEARQQQKAERERADRLERELAELRGTVNALKPQDKPKEEAKPKSFWEDPDAFLAERLAPVQQTMDQQRIELSTMLAVKDHGADLVQEARNSLAEAMKANPSDPSLIALDQATRKSAHPMNEVVAWHQNRKAMAEIGSDPAAYRAKIEAEILAKYNITPEAAAALAAEATPPANVATTSTTTNAAPLTKLPKSLTKLPGGGNAAADGDVSDESVFAHAIGR